MPARPSVAEEAGADAPPDAGAPTPPPGEAPAVVIMADSIETPGDGQRVEAVGNVRATYLDYVLQADRVVLDQAAQTAVAEGNVVQRGEDRELRAERLEWDYATEQGRAIGAVTEYDSVIVRGRELETGPNQHRALDASFTTCDLPRPHYQVTARSITVVPHERIVARGVGLWLLGVRLLTVPRLRYSLREGGGGESLFPTIGYNARDGFYVGRRMRLVDRPDFAIGFDGRLSVRRGFLGGMEGFQTRGRWRWIGAVQLREQAPNQRVRFLDVDRLPEVGILWAPHPGVESRFLPIQVQDVTYDLGDGTDWIAVGQLTAGYFRQRRQQFRGDVAVQESAFRVDARFQLAGPVLRVGTLRIAQPRLLARGALYSGGDHLALLGVGLERRWRVGRDLSIRLERFTHWESGDSRFLFDTVEIRNEWRPRVEVRSGLNTFSWIARYDEDREAVFDQEFGFARVLHCLEPRISYRVRRRQFGLEIRIVALQRGE